MNQLIKIPKFLPLAAIVAIFGIVSILASQPVHAYTSAAKINATLPGGKSTIVYIESGAQKLNYACDDTRFCLNTYGQPYWSNDWISYQGDPASGQQYTLPSTTRTVQLQLNSFFFLTAAKAAKNVDSAVGLTTIRYDTNTAPNMVTNGNYPADRLPARSPNINVAAVTASRNKIYAASVDGGKGSLSNVQVGSIYGPTINKSSRYSIGTPINFTYNSGAWQGLQRTVTIRFNVATINTFDGNVSQCLANGKVLTVDADQFDRCDRRDVTYDFTFFIVPVWNLNPTITVNPANSAFTGETVTTSPAVKNIAEGSSSGTNWVVNSMTYPAGSTPPNTPATSDNYGQTTANLKRPCAYFTTVGARNCQTESSGTGNYAPGDTALSNVDAIIGNYPLGTKVCFTLSVWSKDNTDLNVANQVWAHSAPACLIVARSPNVQIHGGDLKIGQKFADVAGVVPPASATGHISTRVVGASKKTFGSWIEYGMFTTNEVVGVGSGSAYGGGGLDSYTNCRANPITFANTATTNACANGDKLGKFDYKGSVIPNVAAQFPVTKLTLQIGANDLMDQSKQGTFTADGDISLNGGMLNPKRLVVINAPNSTVTINVDMKYSPGPYNSIMELPQLIIIAKNIIIKDNVKQIDGWLIAKGSTIGTDGKINTCASVGENAPLTATVCTTPLVINGPVMAQKLFLRRTPGGGAGVDASTAAETINLRSDAYLWGMAHNANSGRLTTVYETELPPRY